MKHGIPDIIIKTNQRTLAFKMIWLKDLSRKIASDEVLYNKAFNIAKNPKYDGNQREYFLRTINQQKNYKPIIRKFG